jgi:hypothetical protein
VTPVKPIKFCDLLVHHTKVGGVCEIHVEKTFKNVKIILYQGVKNKDHTIFINKALNFNENLLPLIIKIATLVMNK